MRSSQQPTYLLDKNVIRRAIAGIAKAELGRPLTREEDDCLSLLHEARTGKLRLFISIEAFNILQRLSERVEVQVFLASTEIMQVGRYFKRWARRLREHGFTSEDAKMTAQLSSPFCQAVLPDVKRPAEVLAPMPERRTRR
jgi:hypothetical protein